MPRKQPNTVTNTEQKELVGEFCRTIATLKDADQVERFFTDLLSDTEILMLARRIRIARLLLEGNSYTKIADTIGASPNTVANVHRWLQKDVADFSALEKQLAAEIKRTGQKTSPHQNKKKQYHASNTFEGMKERYPMHFLLFNLFSKK